MTLSNEKNQLMKNLINDHGIIASLAIDQRGALKKMIAKYKPQGATEQDLIDYKRLVSQTLTAYSSSILLDPEYGLPAAKARHPNAGLLLAYEKTGYDASIKGRLPDLLSLWSVKRLKAAGADAIKFLLYYDIDEEKQINEQKHAFIERLGAECDDYNMPFYLELVSYDANISDSDSLEYAKVKPHKVNDMMKEFSKPGYGVDVLKVEVPVNMKYVEGFTDGDMAYSKQAAASHFKAQSQSTHLPFIFLSAGVNASLFQQTLYFAKASGSTFNGVLCGRATWANGVEQFVLGGEQAAITWLQTQGRENIDALNAVLAQTATPIKLD
ncbi:tagatose-bisphosphate aldolase [Orbus hercynius]|uniref:Tagatose-bisphosphate aldolase n=1 Tax=Orbus hercynius TaxID=593135 RepID=A0A495RBZ1_9GAMM|nr:tagatose-bisphosphate aldolase [Orbus hercynius]RKS84786.1 tagatose-bisphosphate aldolase [Orbus hercynius]